jgi:protocatechuate 3,4-dioxygenase alpha subunit
VIHGATPSQTVGPFFAIGLPWDEGPHVVPPGTPGAIRVVGTVQDGDGEPVPDHLIETWQSDGAGGFADLHGFGPPSTLEGFRGFARCGREDGDGSYEILTVRPGGDTPWIDVSLFARGLLDRLVTRIYFDLADVPDTVPEPRRGTLVAKAEGDAVYRFDIHIQGESETVFFAV